MLKISQYPRNADGTPMDLEVGVLTDDTGNGGARLTTPPVGPDNAPIDAKGLVLVDSAGNLLPISPMAGSTMRLSTFATAPAVSVPIGTDMVETNGYAVTGQGGALYVYDALVDAAYVAANPLVSFRSLNNRGFRLSEKQNIDIRMLGAVGDGVTDNFAAIQGAINYLFVYRMTVQFGYGKGSAALFVPAAPKEYYCSQKLTISHAMRMIFDNGVGATGASAVLRFPAGQGGILLIRDVVTGGASGSVIERPFLKGGFAGVEGEFHGIEFRCPCRIISPKIFDFQGDGIFADTHLTGAIVNGAVIDNAFCQGNRHGIYLNGEDTNALMLLNPQSSLNRRYGIWSKLTLGNAYLGGNTASNGMVAGFPTICSYLGNQYYCLPNQEVGAKANAPSGTTANNAYWGYWRVGGVTATTPAWVINATDWRSGGSARFEGAFEQNAICALYHEADQAPIQVEASVQMVFISGLSGAPVMFDGALYGGLLTGTGAGLTASRNFTCKGDFKSIIGGIEILRTASNGVFATQPIWIAPDTGSILEVGRVTNAVNARIRPDATAPGLELQSPNFAAVLVLTNGAATVTGTLTATNLTGTNTGDQYASIAQNTVIGRTAAGAGPASALTTLPSAVFPAFTGDVTTVAGNIANTIAANAVTYAKFQQVAANSLVGNPTGSLATAQGITLAGGLAFSGTTLTAAGALIPTSVASTGTVTSSGGAVGYATGAGGTVAQATSRVTGVTLNKLCGAITLFNTTTAAGQFDKFTLTNSQILATDVVNVCVKTATANYIACVLSVAAGSCAIGIYTPAAVGAAEAPVITYTVSRVVNA